MKVVVAGELPLVEELSQRCIDAGHETTLFLVEDFLSALESGFMMEGLADVEVAIEVHNESAEAKQELLLGLGQAIPQEAIILTSALPTSVTEALLSISSTACREATSPCVSRSPMASELFMLSSLGMRES